MCGFCGYVNPKGNNKTIEKMTSKLINRGPNFQDTYIDENVALGHTRLSILDLSSAGNQPMKISYNGNEYIIVYNGEIYNQDEIKSILKEKKIQIKTKCDTELVLLLYIIFGEKVVNFLNGIFAFSIYNKNLNTLFFARDHLGIKPLFYTNPNSNLPFVFASEIKGILAHEEVNAILDREGLKEMFAVGPCHTPGKTFFKDIFELKAGHYAIYKNNTFKTRKYWDLPTYEIKDDEETIIKNIHDMLVSSTKRQLISDVPICTMLSGGIDSSILTKIANDNIKDLTTFSIDFDGNDKNFVANSYQSSRDSVYVDIMKNYLKTNHINITLDNSYLFDMLEKSLIARDMPGMADIDSSMYAFCNSISKNNFKVCISGECSDEIFGGYPWFYKKHLKEAFYENKFPWALSNNLRSNIVNPKLLTKRDIDDYVELSIKSTLKNVVLNSDDKDENYFRSVNYLTIKWFMNTLIERTDRMSMANSLEVRVPYADYKFFEYIYNIPASLKLKKESDETKVVEKNLLRKAFEGEIPNEVLYRKKSPFPKTYDPVYLKLVEDTLTKILNNENSKINKIINKNFVLDMIKMHGESITENWFGQLMTYPQTLAYLIQIEMWLNIYNIKFDF